MEIFKMAISKILDFSAGSKFAIQLPRAISNDWETQNCDWMLFFCYPLVKSRGQPTFSQAYTNLDHSDGRLINHPRMRLIMRQLIWRQSVRRISSRKVFGFAIYKTCVKRDFSSMEGDGIFWFLPKEINKCQWMFKISSFLSQSSHLTEKK